MLQLLREKLLDLKVSNQFDPADFRHGNALYALGNCQILSQSGSFFEVLVEHGESEEVTRIVREDDQVLRYLLNGDPAEWDRYGVAALLQVIEEYERTEPRPIAEGRAYTREGMIRRVLERTRRPGPIITSPLQTISMVSIPSQTRAE